MKLNLNNDVKIKKFYKLLPIYKSFLFRCFKFDINDCDNQEIKIIVAGLNIKNRRKRIEYVFDETCKIIDDYYKDKKTCEFINGICDNHRCMKKDYKNGCCRICRYQSSNGCTSRNLACKLFMCSKVKDKCKVLEFKDINLLKLFSLKNRFLVKSDYFSKREEVIKDLYTYTLSFAAIRVVYRMIRNQIYLRKKFR